MPTSGPTFTLVYDDHVGIVYAFFAYRVRLREEAEDLTQLTFERALRAWPRYDRGRAAPKTWLLAIARNLLIDHYRARGGQLEEPLDHQPEEALGAVEEPPSLGLDPDLAQAVGRLDVREQELLGLRFGGDLTGSEIAEVTGLSVSNVQQILSRTLRRLRSELDSDLRRRDREQHQA